MRLINYEQTVGPPPGPEGEDYMQYNELKIIAPDKTALAKSRELGTEVTRQVVQALRLSSHLIKPDRQWFLISYQHVRIAIV